MTEPILRLIPRQTELMPPNPITISFSAIPFGEKIKTQPLQIICITLVQLLLSMMNGLRSRVFCALPLDIRPRIVRDQMSRCTGLSESVMGRCTRAAPFPPIDLARTLCWTGNRLCREGFGDFLFHRLVSDIVAIAVMEFTNLSLHAW